MRAARCTLPCSHLGGGLSVCRRSVRMLVDHVAKLALFAGKSASTPTGGKAQKKVSAMPGAATVMTIKANAEKKKAAEAAEGGGTSPNPNIEAKAKAAAREEAQAAER
eukprot:53179-Prymnesium_polylepis.1